MMKDLRYICIDLKSFYASCECVARGLDPDKTPLVVADSRRGRGALCLAVSPALKALGVRNRCRLYEIPPGIPYWIARPRMAEYIRMSADIYGMYLEHFAPEDIHVYSIDESFIDAAPYLHLYTTTSERLATYLLAEMRRRFGLTATAGIGSNLFLSKVALDVLAKHDPTHMASLDVKWYQELLWDHRPLTDFWQIARGTASRLESLGITTMRELALAQPEALKKALGERGMLLKERALGYDRLTLADIKAYEPRSRSLSSGQILPRAYSIEEGEIIVKEIGELLALELIQKNLAASGLTLTIGYEDATQLAPSCASRRFNVSCRSPRLLKKEALGLYRNIVRHAPVRRLALCFTGLVPADQAPRLLINAEADEREQALYGVIALLKKRYGEVSVLRALDLEAGATARERSCLIGGHNAA